MPTGRCGTRWRSVTKVSATRRSSRCCARTTSRSSSPTRPGRSRTSLEDVTAGFVYVRLHGDTELYVSGYAPDALDRWGARVRAWLAGESPVENPVAPPAAPTPRDVYVYFDNDVKVAAPFDAIALAERVD